MHSTISGLLPRLTAATLDMWTTHDWSQGVLLPQLAPHDRVVVRTRNSTYELIVTVPHTASVLVRGGAFLPDFTPARLAGSSMGGGCLKLYGVYAGFQMELVTEDLPLITTQVRSIRVLRARDGTVM